MNVNDYLIDQARFDWQAMLAGWADILPETFTMWLVNRFGDVFIIAARFTTSTSHAAPCTGSLTLETSSRT